MRREDIGDVLVCEEGDRLLGIVTDRDIVVRALAEGRDPAETRVAEVCSRDLVTIEPGDSVGGAVRLMREKAIRPIPVNGDGRVVGVLTIGDIAVERIHAPRWPIARPRGRTPDLPAGAIRPGREVPSQRAASPRDSSPARPLRSSGVARSMLLHGQGGFDQ